jgi:hypothetical protein
MRCFARLWCQIRRPTARHTRWIIRISRCMVCRQNVAMQGLRFVPPTVSSMSQQLRVPLGFAARLQSAQAETRQPGKVTGKRTSGSAEDDNDTHDADDRGDQRCGG